MKKIKNAPPKRNLARVALVRPVQHTGAETLAEPHRLPLCLLFRRRHGRREAQERVAAEVRCDPVRGEFGGVAEVGRELKEGERWEVGCGD